MKRVQVADLQRTLLEPQARPVDAYERAGGVDPSQGLRSLAESLAGVQPSLMNALAKQDKRDEEEAILRAQRDRMKNQMTFAEGVAEGVISEGENPYYVKAYKRLDGRMAGRQEYLQQVSQAYEESGLAYKDFNSEGERQTALSDFLQAQREQFLQGKDDIHWIDGAADGINQAEAQFNQRFMQDVANVNSERATLTMQKQIGEFLYSDAPIEMRAAHIAAFGKGNRGQFGISYTKFNDTVINTVQAEAKTLALAGRYDEAMEMLSTINYVETRDGATLGSTGAGRKAVGDTAAMIQQIQRNNDTYARSLESHEWSRQSHEWTQLTRSRQLDEWAADDAVVAAYQWIGQNPGGDFEGKLQELIAREPKVAKMATTLRNAYQNRLRSDRIVLEDKTVLTQMRIRINRGEDVLQELGRMHDQGDLSTDTFFQMMDDAARHRSANGRLKSLPQESQELIKDQGKFLEDLAKGQALPGGVFRSEGIEKAMQVNRMYNNAITAYLNENPNATYTQLDEYIGKTISRFKQHPIFSGSGIGSVNLTPNPQLPGAAAQPATPQSSNPFDSFDKGF